MWEFRGIKVFLLKDILKIDQKKFLFINTFSWTYVSSDLNGKPIVGTLQKTNLEITNYKSKNYKSLI